MSRIIAYCYDYLMRGPEQACLIDWRRELLSQVSGRVLEIGAGTGASLPLYPKKQELELVLTEPDKDMRGRLAAAIAKMPDCQITLLDCPAESLACDDASFDWVFVSLVCCSVNDLPRTLKEIWRVLKPGAHLLFLEHVAAEPGSRRRRWQDRLNFIWRRIAGNCHLNRETEVQLRLAGFEIESIRRESMRKAFSLARPTIRGVARKPQQPEQPS
ncbi:class I SAM-dependent methyltransferase [Shewanella marisflavi]|uniref:class I SAM-dependent methyltransferase n=1 Tax=Shewanella marisflavi TaxID=260364 RepID=UPI00200D798B|nr:class I SAM-dependent methyltransferase [Shewanella marisflavi]MCL1040468.1 class I SAM-dependent methyltransferase [Shewanella marisflavi]